MEVKILSSPAAWVQTSTLGMVGATVHLQGEALMFTPHPCPGAMRQEVGQAGCGPQPAGGDSPAP